MSNWTGLGGRDFFSPYGIGGGICATNLWQAQKGLDLLQDFRAAGRVELPQGGLLGGVLVIVHAVPEAAERRGGTGRPQEPGQALRQPGHVAPYRPEVQNQVVPGQP